jgi:unsaturated chondroitin disaccharide hydrolase
VDFPSNDTYRAKYGENGGFLIKHWGGALTLNSEIDAPLVYADYYFLEALKRYNDWYLKKTLTRLFLKTCFCLVCY